MGNSRAPSSDKEGAPDRPKGRAAKARPVIPGFGLTLGYTIMYLSLIVLIPLTATFVRSF
ncbi:MAG: hypothetical protein JWN43_885, partial [Gammaproteobacteria bacterium]|nr:hypothetical protein [Gammaproteobacteria bacterium]